MLIDTHCHLNFKVFEGKVDKVFQKARQAGVEKIIIPGSNLETSREAIQLADKHDGLYASVGIHPHHVFDGKLGTIDLEKKLVDLIKSSDKVIAVGECGLDYHDYKNTKYKNYQLDNDFKNQQKKIFLLHLKIASQLEKPAIIHNREASEDLGKLLGSQLKKLKIRGVFHCFSGTKQILEWAIKNDFYIGIDGNITYSKTVRQAVKKTPLKKILLETDSPYLIPEPLKSQGVFPNTPENVRIVAEKVAEIKKVSFNKVARVTTRNAKELFGL